MHRGCPPPVPIHGIAFSLILVRTRIKVASGKWRRVNVPRDDDDDEEPLPFLSLLFKRRSSQRDRTKNILFSQTKFIHAHVFSPAFLESLKRDARLLFSRILRFFSSSSRVKISLEIRWKPITYRLGGGSGWLADDKSRREGFVNATRV